MELLFLSKQDWIQTVSLTAAKLGNIFSLCLFPVMLLSKICRVTILLILIYNPSVIWIKSREKQYTEILLIVY